MLQKIIDIGVIILVFAVGITVIVGNVIGKDTTSITSEMAMFMTFWLWLKLGMNDGNN